MGSSLSELWVLGHLDLPELTHRLDALEAFLPALIAGNPSPADFWRVFTAEAEVLEDEAGEHAALVADRVCAVLAAHGRALVSV
jgi:hypothetical protein